MGAVLGVVAATDATVATGVQASASNWLEDALRPLVRWLEPVPDVIVGLGLVAIALGAIAISGRRRPLPTDETDGSCHEQSKEPDKAAASSLE